MAEIERLRAAIIAELDEVKRIVGAAGAELQARLAAVERERDDAQDAAQTAEDQYEAEKVARAGVEAAFGAYRAQIEQLADDIEAPGIFGDDTAAPDGGADEAGDLEPGIDEGEEG